jgi:hypothetical protein
MRQILDILHDLIASDRSFYSSPVFALPDPLRGRTLLNQSRTTGAILDLVRMMYVTPPLPDCELTRITAS